MKEETFLVLHPRAWTRPSKEREEERKRECERKERAKMGTDLTLSHFNKEKVNGRKNGKREDV